MKHCGYCDIDVEDPCTDSRNAMNCSKDFNDAGVKPPSPSKVHEVEDADDDMEAIIDRRYQETVDQYNVDPAWSAGMDVDHKKTYHSEGGKEGIKFDDEKVRMDLIPPELNKAVATVLKFGAEKYSDRNWEKGMSWGRVFGAIMRHLWAWWGGEKNDAESGLPHLWHAGCCIAFLIAYEDREIGTDDRYNPKENE